MTDEQDFLFTLQIDRLSSSTLFQSKSHSIDPSEDVHHDKHSSSTMSGTHPLVSSHYSRSNMTFMSHQHSPSRIDHHSSSLSSARPPTTDKSGLPSPRLSRLLSIRSVMTRIDRSRLLVSRALKDTQLDSSSMTTLTLSQDLEMSPYKLFRDKIDNENLHFRWPSESSPSFPPTPQIDLERDVKHVRNTTMIDRVRFSVLFQSKGITFVVEDTFYHENTLSHGQSG